MAYTITLCIYLVASPFLGAVAPFHPSRSRFGPDGIGVLLARLPFPEPVLRSLRGDGALSSPLAFGLSYVTLVMISTMLWLSALVVIHKYRNVISDVLADSIFRWSMVFTAVLLFATPVQVHDFWLSIAWGRVVADGANPYYALPTALSDLPLGDGPALMTYGPLWALITGATAVLAGGNALGMAALQKICMGAAWVGAVRTVRALTRDQTAAAQCTALVVLGWAPLGLLQGVADGHTDVLLIFPMLLWLLWLERVKPVSSAVALAASVCIKYVTAPLLLLHFARGLTRRSSDRRLWFASAFAGVFVVLLFVAVFYRSPEFFAPVREMNWRFFTPAAVLDGAARRVGLSWDWLAPALDFAFVAVAATLAIRWLRSESHTAFRAAALWMMCGVLIGGVGHVWPWYVLWVLGLAAIQPARRIAWFVVGMTAAAPFILVPWTLNPELDAIVRIGLPGVVLYASGVAGLLLGGRARSYLR